MTCCSSLVFIPHRADCWFHHFMTCSLLRSFAKPDTSGYMKQLLRLQLQTGQHARMRSTMQATAVTRAADSTAAVKDAKKAMRSQIKQNLKAMAVEEMRQQSSQIAQRVMQSSIFQEARRVGLYITCERLREVDTMALLAAALQQGKHCFVPLVEDSQSNMALLHIDSLEELHPAPPFGILEPNKHTADGAERQNAMQVAGGLDLLLMPGLGFDREGGRLGRGGGYYDKLVHALDERAQQNGWQPPWLVALAFSQQLVGEVPTSHHDRHVDVLATATELMRCSDRAKKHS